jgi:hypothetical protein
MFSVDGAEVLLQRQFHLYLSEVDAKFTSLEEDGDILRAVFGKDQSEGVSDAS